MTEKSIAASAKARGKNYFRSVMAAQRRVKDDAQYFIRRGAKGYFRPNACGYTRHLSDAGIYTGKDARGYLSAEGIELVPVKLMLDQLRAELAEIEARQRYLSDLAGRLQP